MSLLPPLDSWSFFTPAPAPADAQADLRALVDAMLENELLTFDSDDTIRLLLQTRLRSTVVDVVANTLQQLCALDQQDA